MTLREVDSKTILDSFHMQMGLIEERMEQLELMKSALKDASDIIERGADADWSHMLDLVNMNEMEQKLKKQYKDASNISARINLHRDYSLNPVSWFEWILINVHLNRAIVCWNWGAEMHLYGRGMLSAYRQIWIYC